MTSPALRITVPLRPLLILGALLALIAVAAFVLQSSPADDGPAGRTVSGSETAPFEMQLADAWKAVPDDKLAQLPGAPLAVVRSADGSGTVVIARGPGTELSFERAAAGLRRRLKSRFPDLREVSAKITTLPAGRALVYSFARTRSGIAQTVAILPSRSSTYSINAVIRPGTPATAREVGAMLGTFDVPSPR